MAAVAQQIEANESRLHGADELDWLAYLRTILPDLRAAWQWAGQAGDDGLLVVMLHSLAHLYDVAGLYREGIGLLAAAESRLPSSAAQLTRGRLLSWIGRFHYHIGEYEAAQQTLAAASDLLRPLDALALALTYRGEAARSAGDFAAARRYQTESAALARAAGSVQVETLALLHSGKVEIAEGKYQAAQAAAETGLNLARQAGGPPNFSPLPPLIPPPGSMSGPRRGGCWLRWAARKWTGLS
jgi:tetratricopeptide (TPR) repeat protein